MVREWDKQKGKTHVWKVIAKAGRIVSGITMNRTKSRAIISDTMMKKGPTRRSSMR